MNTPTEDLANPTRMASKPPETSSPSAGMVFSLRPIGGWQPDDYKDNWWRGCSGYDDPPPSPDDGYKLPGLVKEIFLKIKIKMVEACKRSRSWLMEKWMWIGSTVFSEPQKLTANRKDNPARPRSKNFNPDLDSVKPVRRSINQLWVERVAKKAESEQGVNLPKPPSQPTQPAISLWAARVAQKAMKQAEEEQAFIDGLQFPFSSTFDLDLATEEDLLQRLNRIKSILARKASEREQGDGPRKLSKG